MPHLIKARTEFFNNQQKNKMRTSIGHLSRKEFQKIFEYEIKLWHKIVFPVYIWKKFMMAKKKAFEFKYEPKTMKRLEEKQMQVIGWTQFFYTFVFYSIMLSLPFIFVHDECAEGMKPPALWIYGIYAALTAIWEIYTVLKIQRLVNNKDILDFNLWHGTELVMG